MDAVQQRILAVDQQEGALLEMRSVLSSLPSVEVIGVDSVASALSELDRERPNILITKSHLSDGDALQIVSKVENLGLSIPVFIRRDAGELLSTSEDPKHARITVFEQSTSIGDLCDRVAEQLERQRRRPRRHTDPFGIVDYLQLAGFSRRTVELDVEVHGERHGWIRVVEGEVWAAAYGALRGVEAIAALVASPVEQIEVVELGGEVGPRELEVSINGLLLEFARLEDEARREAQALLEEGGERPEWSLEGWLGVEDAGGEVLLPPQVVRPGPEPETQAETETETEAEVEPEPGEDDHPCVRELLAALARRDTEEVAARLAELSPERAQARAWLRALTEDQPELEPDPRVHLLGFELDRAEALVELLAQAGVEALALTEAALLEGQRRPALLVAHLDLPDDYDDLEAQTLARFDPIWALRVGPRTCPWIAVTPRPTRFGSSLCTVLGAEAWFAQEPVEPDDELLAQALAECVHTLAEAPRPPRERLGALDLALMLIDLEVDARVELRGEQGRGSLDILGCELFAASLEGEGEGEIGVQAAAELCTWDAAATALLPPRLGLRRNLPRGLPLALAALASTLSNPDSKNHSTPHIHKEHETSMSNLNSVCEAVVDDVADALACGVVDLDTGMLMGIHHTIAYFTQSYLDAVAAAAVDMFRGKNVRRVERLISKHRGQEVTDAFEEIFISSKAVFHFMKLIPDKGAVVVLVTRKTTNQGMGWSSLRLANDDISAALP